MDIAIKALKGLAVISLALAYLLKRVRGHALQMQAAAAGSALTGKE